MTTKTRKLSYEEYQQTFRAPMLDVTATAEPVLDIWSYVDLVPVTDLNGVKLLDGLVKYVYLHPGKQFEHVLVSTENTDIFLVIVIDLSRAKIYGHHLLDLLSFYAIASHFEE